MRRYLVVAIALLAGFTNGIRAEENCPPVGVGFPSYVLPPAPRTYYYPPPTIIETRECKDQSTAFFVFVDFPRNAKLYSVLRGPTRAGDPEKVREVPFNRLASDGSRSMNTDPIARNTDAQFYLRVSYVDGSNKTVVLERKFTVRGKDIVKLYMKDFKEPELPAPPPPKTAPPPPKVSTPTGPGVTEDLADNRGSLKIGPRLTLERARELMEKEDYVGAAEKLESSINDINGNSEYLKALAMAYENGIAQLVKKGETEKAKSMLRYLTIVAPERAKLIVIR